MYKQWLIVLYYSDFGFWRDDKGECQFYGRHPDRPVDCKDNFRGRSGYKKNPASVCSGGINLEEQREWPCGEAGDVQSTKVSTTPPSY